LPLQTIGSRGAEVSALAIRAAHLFANAALARTAINLVFQLAHALPAFRLDAESRWRAIARAFALDVTTSEGAGKWIVAIRVDATALAEFGQLGAFFSRVRTTGPNQDAQQRARQK
jgi:hypothetical protein